MRFRAFVGIPLFAVVLSGAALTAQLPAPGAQAPAGAADLLFARGKGNFDAAQYDQAAPAFDGVIAALTVGGQVQRPDLIVQAYELRARTRFALGDQPGAEQDFAALLAVKPSFSLGDGVSPRVVAVFDAVKHLTIGQVSLSMTPTGTAEIDGRPYALQADAQTIAITAGEHEVTAVRPGYRSLSQKFTVAGGEMATVTLSMERVSATLSVISIPDGVEVLVDGQSRGRTTAGASGGSSAPLQLNDLAPGAHRLQLRRTCYRAIDQTVTIDQPADIRLDPLPLMPAVAVVKIHTSDPTPLFIDGAARGQAPVDLDDLCEGPHVIELRGPAGRFIDRRDWKMGDAETLQADLRSAFPIVSAKGGASLNVEQLRSTVERVLGPAKHVLVYAPADADLQAAMRGENVNPAWLATDPSAAERLPKAAVRDVGTRLAGKLDTQGVSAVSEGSTPYSVSISLLAAGSGEPDLVKINTADPASVARALDIFGAPLPPLVRPALEASIVDVAGVQGAVVVRTFGAGAKAGLTVGDTIVGAAGAPVASVADLQSAIAKLKPGADLPLDVKGMAGASRKVSGAVATVPDTLPLRDPSVLYNRALVEVSNAVKKAATPVEVSAAHLNLAIVWMRLGVWDQAQTELSAVKLPDGPGVSAGSVAYLTGLCFEALGRTADAQAAFTKAAAAPQARLSADGPFVAPLAKQRLRPR